MKFWERVELVWPYLSQEEQHHAYFTKAVDYPRSLKTLEAAESRRQFTLPLELITQKPEPSEFADLEAERDRLIKATEFAPENGWIETGKVKGKDFRQAWWRGKFSGGKKTIYIGREGSPEYGKAKNAQQARKQLKKVLRQIEHLKKQSNVVSGKR